MFAPLRQRNFALLWSGGLVSIIGDRVLHTILPFYIYQQSHSTLATAALVTCNLLPRVLFGSMAGVLVDRWDRRRVMVACALLQALALLPLLLLPLTGQLWIVYVVSLLETSIALFFRPAENALLPRLVADELLVSANALNALNNNLARLAGPPIGGLVYALGGLWGVILVDAVSFLLAAVAIVLVRQPAGARVERQIASAGDADKAPQADSRGFWVEWREGLAYIRQSPVLIRLIGLTIMLNLGGVMMDPIYVPFVVDVVGAGPQTLGWLLTLRGAGGIVGGLIAGRIGQTLRKHGQIFGHSEIALGILLVVMFNVPVLPVVAGIMFATGVPGVIGMTVLDTMFQRVTPDAYMGRVFGLLDTVMSVISVFGVLGLGGLLSSAIGVVPVLNLAASITLGTGIAALLTLPRRLRSFQSIPQPG